MYEGNNREREAKIYRYLELELSSWRTLRSAALVYTQ